MADASAKEVTAVEKLKEAKRVLVGEIHKIIIGQDEVIELILIALFSRAHALLVGVPGLAKTLLVRTIASVLNLDFKRIQFTPDLMPSDITGTEIIDEDRETGRRSFRFVRGPLFSNLVLADEINRTPPKTQAALLEAMQEYQITVGGQRHVLDEPFFVLATQNPIEQEGTYPLPEAQLDRFMFEVRIGYPSLEEERIIVRETTREQENELKPVLDGKDILALQRIVRRMPVSDHVADYALYLTRATRPNEDGASEFVRKWLSWGAGPRAAQCLVLGAKSRAILEGRYAATCEDVRALAVPVMRHRIITNFNADSEGVSPVDVINKLLEDVKEPSEKDYK